MARIQFILKARESTSEYCYESGGVSTWEGGHVDPSKLLSSGLLNSATFVAEMLRDELDHTVKVDHAIDNNMIDSLVSSFKPDIVIIEAFWVVPEKFAILHALHPRVTWIVRNHSAMPFLANEGIGIDWSLRYMDYPNVVMSCNDTRTNAEIRNLVTIYKPGWSDLEVENRTTYLPNYYPINYKTGRRKTETPYLNVACFGAMRPLKNHLIQAIAAIDYAEKNHKTLRFHVNATRVEMNGQSVVTNLRRLFGHMPHQLVEHNWTAHEDFTKLCRQMDIGLQVSYTETFNIVAADLVMSGVPVVTSPEVKWVHKLFHADPNLSTDITAKMGTALWFRNHVGMWKPNLTGLVDSNLASVVAWDDAINGIMSKAGRV